MPRRRQKAAHLAFEEQEIARLRQVRRVPPTMMHLAARRRSNRRNDSPVLADLEPRSRHLQRHLTRLPLKTKCRKGLPDSQDKPGLRTSQYKDMAFKVRRACVVATMAASAAIWH